MLIRDLAQACGISTKTIRYWTFADFGIMYLNNR